MPFSLTPDCLFPNLRSSESNFLSPIVDVSHAYNAAEAVGLAKDILDKVYFLKKTLKDK
jgi:hypothetical protein